MNARHWDSNGLLPRKKDPDELWDAPEPAWPGYPDTAPEDGGTDDWPHGAEWDTYHVASPHIDNAEAA